jgi:7,8-dihydropterin-6-yl-methyl-4-(beta-D-ribofuranosyl)aminobenzene 5'-phosphate synthase
VARLTVLVENTGLDRNLVTEHGLSILIEAGGEAVLFDTGPSPSSLINAARLGSLPASLSAIVLSHGHYDHTGGLKAWLKEYPGTRVIAHPAAFGPHFAVRQMEGREIGSPTPRAWVEEAGQLFLTAEPIEVIPGLTTTGQIPRLTGFEDPGGPFFHDPGGRTPDSIPDDQALILDLPGGLAVVCGCAHAGVVNTLLQVDQLKPGRPVSLLAGGFHLLIAGPERLGPTLKELQARQIRSLMPGHCTGEGAIALMAAVFAGSFRRLQTGLRINLEEA